MIRLLEKITSLRNLSRANTGGQVATLLTLMMVAAIVLILVTVNIGQRAQGAQAIADAADSGALYLASQLSTKSYQLWDALGQDTEKCQKGGFLALFLAIILAVIIVLVLIFCQPCLLLLFQAAAAMGSASAATAALLATSVGGGMLVASTTTLVIAGAVAGAVGGAIGGAIAGTGALQGAITGAAVGAAIGMCGAGIAGAPAGGTAGALGVGETAGAGTASLGGLSAASSVYNAYVEDQIASDAMSAATKSINGLPEYDTYREGVFYQALTQLVDDPNTTKDKNICKESLEEGKAECETGDKFDPYDSDGDGDKKEKIPYFQYWWDRRMEVLKKIYPKLKAQTENFVKGSNDDDTQEEEVSYSWGASQSMDDLGFDYGDTNADGLSSVALFNEVAKRQYKAKISNGACSDTNGDGSPDCGYGRSWGGEYGYSWEYSYGFLSRQEIEEKVIYDDNAKSLGLAEGAVTAVDGTLVSLSRGLKDAGLKPFFYKGGTPDKDYCDSDSNADGIADGTCLDAYHDEIDAARAMMRDFVDTAQGVTKLNVDKLTSTWQSWVKFFYDGKEVDYYEEAGKNSGNYSCTFSAVSAGEGNFKKDADTGAYYFAGDDQGDYEGDCYYAGKNKGSYKLKREYEHIDYTPTLDDDGNPVKEGNYDKDADDNYTYVGDNNGYYVVNGDFYSLFDVLLYGEDVEGSEEEKGDFKGLIAWKKEIEKKRKSLAKKGNNQCQVNYVLYSEGGYSAGASEGATESCAYYLNGEDGDGELPCWNESVYAGVLDEKTYYGGSTDKCQDDEFLESIKGLDKLIREIKHFREASKSYYEKMNKIYDSIEDDYGIDYGGLNPVTYNWTDSRSPADSDDNDEDGDKTELLAQSVSVQTSQYRVPYVKKEKSGSFLSKKTCMVLTDYKDETGKGTWVKITRREPANASVGAGGLSLGKWNAETETVKDAEGNETEKDKVYTKISHISYAKHNGAAGEGKYINGKYVGGSYVELIKSKSE